MHIRLHRNHKPTDNIAYQFVLGAVLELSGQAAFIESCFQNVPGWEVAGKDEDEKASEKNPESLDKQLREETPTFDKIIGYLGVTLDIVCSVKDKIIDFFTKKAKKLLKLFIQSGKRRTVMKWTFSGFVTSANRGISAVGSAIISGAQKIKTTVVDGVDWGKKKANEISEFIKENLQRKLQPCLDILENIKAKIIKWLKYHPLLLKLVLFFKCFLDNKAAKAVEQLITVIKSYMQLIPTLTTPAGWVTLVVNLICGWENLKDGIGFLTAGMKEDDKGKKYNFFGKFVGKVLLAIAG